MIERDSHTSAVGRLKIAALLDFCHFQQLPWK